MLKRVVCHPYRGEDKVLRVSIVLENHLGRTRMIESVLDPKALLRIQSGTGETIEFIIYRKKRTRTLMLAMRVILLDTSEVKLDRELTETEIVFDLPRAPRGRRLN